MKLCSSIQGSQPLSRYGDQSLDLTLGITRDVLQQPSLGLHRFEPVVWNDVATVPGNVTYPTRNFALALLPRLCRNAALPRSERRVPFTLLLHVAMQMGLYLHRRERRCLACSL
jgi:hypothetical protein